MFRLRFLIHKPKLNIPRGTVYRFINRYGNFRSSGKIFIRLIQIITRVAGIVAIYNLVAESDSNILAQYLSHSMQMLQHRGKAYWKMVMGDGIIDREGSLPSSDDIFKMVQEKKLYASNAI